MRNARKFLTLLLAVLMVVGMFSTVSASKFEDVSASDTALSDAVDLLLAIGVTKGTSETTFGTDEFVTRQQMAAFMYRFMKGGKSMEGGENTTSFTDLVDPTYNYMISWASEKGIVKGRSATQFDPTGTIILQDAYTMVVRALGYEDKQTLSYPYGYIDIAEQIGLNENIGLMPYEEELTRGDIAIILYNAFYAPLPPKTVKMGGKEVEVPQEGSIATTVFNLTKQVKRVVATKNQYLDNYPVNAGMNDGEEYVLLADMAFGSEKKDDGGNYITETFKFEDLKLSGSSDDYMLADLTIFYNGEDIIATQQSLVREGGASFGRRWSREKAEDYNNQEFNGAINTTSMKGFLYGMSAEFKRNANPTKLITRGKAEEEGQVHYITNYSEILGSNTTFDPNGDWESPLTDGSSNNNRLAMSCFSQARYSGCYYGEGFDCNGDGYMDYFWYKPMTMGFATYNNKSTGSGKNKVYTYSTVNQHTAAHNSAVRACEVMNDKLGHNEPIIYTYGADIEGVSFNDGDMILAYVDGPGNYIYVNSIVEPLKTKITSALSGKNGIIFLDGSSTYLFDPAARILGHMFFKDAYYSMESMSNETGGNDRTFQNDKCNLFVPGVTGWFYLVKGKMMYIDHIGEDITLEDGTVIKSNRDVGDKGAGSLNYSGNLVLVDFYDEDTGDVLFKVQNFIKEEGRFSETKYVNGYLEGKLQAIMIADKDAYGNEITNDYLIDNYVDKLASFTVNSKGECVLKYLDFTKDNDKSVLESDDASKIYAFKSAKGDTATLKRSSDNLYSFGTSSTISFPCKYVSFDSNTKFTIKYTDNDDKIKFATYTVDNLPNFADTVKFKNVHYVLTNNTSSNTIEKLGFFYAEATTKIAQDISGATEYRIVTGYYLGLDEDDNPMYYYNLWNPAKLTAETDVPGTKAYVEDNMSVAGEIYYLADGKLQNDTKPVAVLQESTSIRLNAYDSDSFTVIIGGKIYTCDPATKVTFYNKGACSAKTVGALDPTSDAYVCSDGKHLCVYTYGEEVDGTSDYQRLAWAVIVRTADPPEK